MDALTAEAGKSVGFLIDKYSLKDVAAIGRRVPKLRIILDPGWVEDFRAAAKLPNVYGKVSAPTELAFYRSILDLAWGSSGEKRLVFGSDWPVTGTTGDYASVLALTGAYFEPKGAEVGEKLFHRNAVRFYAIPASDCA